jgi:hypothetical protein
VNEHRRGKDDEVQTGEGFGQPFVVACESMEPFEPAKATLDYPSTGQPYESLLRFSQPDDLQLDALVGGRLCTEPARIGMIGKCPFHRPTGHMLNLTRKLSRLRAVRYHTSTAGCAHPE